MSMSGDDARLGFTAEVDADAAADELRAEFSKAIAEALKNPAIEQAFTRMAALVGRKLNTEIGKAFAGKGRGGDPFKPFVQSADRAAKKISDRFAKVAREAGNSFNSFKGPGAAGLRGLSAQIEGIARSFDDLRSATEGQIRALEAMERQARASADVQARLARDVANTEQQTARERLVADQTATARALSNARRRLEIFRQVAAQVRFLERAVAATFSRISDIVGRTLRGIGRLAESAFRSIGNRINNLFTRRAGGGTDGLRQRERDLRRSFDRQEAIIRQSAAEQSRLLDRLTRQQSRGIAGVATGRSNLANALGITGLVAGGAGIGSFLRSGFQRAGEEERLQLQFEALLQDGPKAQRVLQDLSEYARTTAFDFTEVAASVASMTASFSGDVGRATEINQFLSDIVALTGGGNQQFANAALAFRQVASAGRLMGDELRQLEESLPGIPIRDILIDTFFEGDKAAFAKAQQAGKLGEFVSADAFFDAIMAGVRERFPEAEGFAVEAATTLSGLAANLRENFDIFGAEVIRVFQGPIKSFIGGLNDLLDSLGNFISGEGLTPNLERLRDVLADFGKGLLGLAALKGLGEALKFAAIGARALVTPLGLLVTIAGGVSVFWGMLTDASETLRTALDGLVEALGPLASALGGLVTGGLNRLFELITGNQGSLESIGDAVAGVVDKITGAITKTTEWLELLRDALGLPSGSAAAPGGPGRFSANNPFAAAAGGANAPDVGNIFSNIFGDAANEEILIPISELPAEAQKVFAENFADVQWVSAQDAAEIWEQFSPDAQQFSDAVTPDDAAVNAARQALLKKVSDLFGLKDAQFETAMSGGGNRLLNLLEETWLGPVIRFFRGPFSTGIKAALGFVGGVIDFGGGLFEAITGSDDGTGRTLGQRLYDFIFEDSAIADIASGARDLFFEIRDFFAPAFDTVKNAISGAWNVIQPIIQPFIDGITNLIDTLRNADWGSLDFGNIAAGAGVGGGIGLLLGGPIGALLGGTAGALTQTPVFQGLIDSFDNLWELVQPKLESFWNSLTGWLSERFSEKNLKKYAIGFFNGLREIGEQIGRILSEPEVVAGAVAFGAAIAAILLSFSVGLIQGIASNIDEWAKIFGDGLNAAWDALSGAALDFVPDPIVDAIGALLKNPVIGLATSAFGIGLSALIFTSIGSALKGRRKGAPGSGGAGFSFTGIATGFAGGLLTSLSNAFKDVFKGGLNITRMIFGGGKLSSSTLSYDAEGKLQGVGRSIASSIAVGIASFAGGVVAGRSGSIGNVILSILGGAGAGAAVGTAILPGIGTAIGAGLGGALAGLGAAIGSSGQQAAKAKQEIQEYADALVGLGSPVEVATAGVKVFTENLFDEDLGLQEFLADAEFDIQGFVERVIAGTSSIPDELARALEGFADTDLGDFADIFDDLQVPDFFADMGVEELNPSVDELRQNLLGIADIIRRTGLTNDSDIISEIRRLTQEGLVLPEVGANAEAVIQALNDAGFSFSDFVDLVGDEGGELAKALEVADIKNRLNELATGAEETGIKFEGVADAAGQIAEQLRGGSTAEEIRQILNQSNLSSEERIAALTEASELLRDAAGEARDEIQTLIGQRIGGLDVEGIRRGFRLDLPNIQDQIADALNIDTSEGAAVTIPVDYEFGTDDNLDQVLVDFRDRVSAALEEAVGTGEISSSVDLADFIQGLRDDIAASDLSTSVQEELNAQLDTIALSLSGLSFTDITAPEAAAAAVGEALAGSLIAGYQRILAAPQNFSFNQLSLAEDTRFGGGRSGGGGSSNPVQDQINGMANSIDYSPLTEIGEKIPTEVNSGITNNAGEISRGVQDAIDGARNVGAGEAFGLVGVGNSMITAMSAGVTTQSGRLAGAIGSAVRSAGVGAQVASVAMFAIGANLGNAMASGIRSQSGAVAAAARAVASAAASAARRNLKIASPSKVFIDIGQQVGAGFAKGIQDSETTMADAISKALTEAVDKATEKVGKAVARSRAAEEIFKALTPSTLPGGTSTADVSQAIIEQRLTVLGRTGDNRDRIAELIGNAGSASGVAARIGINQSALGLRQHFQALRDEVTEAKAAKKAIADYDASLKRLNQQRASGTLGQQLYNREVAELNEQLGLGSITRNKYNQELKELNAALKSGKLNTEEFNDQIKELGNRPSALTFRQLNLIASGAGSFSSSTFAGAENQQAVAESLEAVREWGQEAVLAGNNVNNVIATMDKYIASLRQQAVAAGISGAQFDDLAKQLGLNASTLKGLIAGLTSLNIGTEQGAQNVQRVLGDLQSIREFGQALVGSGVSAESAVAQMKAFRNALLQQGTAFGFSGSELAKLVDQVGLSDSALAEFVRQMREFEKAANDAANAQDPNTAAPAPAVENLNIYTQYGDPEAIGLTVANRLAYRTPRR